MCEGVLSFGLGGEGCLALVHLLRSRGRFLLLFLLVLLLVLLLLLLALLASLLLLRGRLLPGLHLRKLLG